MKFFKHKFYGKHGFRSRLSADWDKAIRDYRHHWESISLQLPSCAIALHNHNKRYPFHDADIGEITRPVQGEFVVDLDDRRLEFIGVRGQACSIEEFPAVWIECEIDKASPNTFELRVLSDRGEFSVIAENVRVYDKCAGRYVVPEQQPTPKPTLFSDRKK